MGIKRGQHRSGKAERVKRIREGESLRFRDQKGRYVKFDARKKLISEIWFHGQKTDRTFNATKKGKPVPEKLDAKMTKKRLRLVQEFKARPKQKSEFQKLQFQLNPNHTIADNLEVKADAYISDVVKLSRSGNSVILHITIRTKKPKNGVWSELLLSRRMVSRSINRDYIILETARLIISALYQNNLRASNIKKTKLIGENGNNGHFIRKTTITLEWAESIRLREI